MSPNQAENGEVESNAQASIQGATVSDPISEVRESETRKAFFHLMLKGFTKYMRTNSMAQRPPPPPIP